LKSFFHRLILLVTVVHLTGGQWGMLQMVAWGRMIVEYSAERGLAQGIEDTFDGEHGCSMCKKIWEEHNKQKRDQQNLTQLEKLVKVFPATEAVALSKRWSSPEQSHLAYALPQQMSAQWSSGPEAPPPRA
jgi:hypothetical protein